MLNGQLLRGEVWHGRIAERLKYAEHLLYIVVGATLAVAGFGLFGEVVYKFFLDAGVRRHGLERSLLDAVNGLLLVFIFAELLHTVRAVVAHDALETEPFVVVGIVAAIRRFIVVSAQASEAVRDDLFARLMLELGMLMGSVLVLGCTIWLLRRSRISRTGRTRDVSTESRGRRAYARRRSGSRTGH
jgi:uncharacterized membrane protein (DUF373 family)